MKTLNSKQTKSKKQKSINYHTIIYAVIFLLILIGAYLLYTIVKPQDIAGKAWGTGSDGQISLVTHDEFGLFVNLNPLLTNPSDFLGSMHYNWKKRVIDNTKSITVVNLPMENIITNKVGDISGNNNGGIVNNGATISNGILGKALSFDGVDDYVTIGDENLVLDKDFTIEMWFNTNDDVGYIFRNNIGDDTTNSFVIFVQDMGKDQTPHQIIGWYQDNSGSTIPIADELYGIKTTYEQDKWNHVVTSFDQSENVLKAYLNGEELSSMDFDTTINIHTFGPLKGPFYIGKRLDNMGTDAAYYSGLIDEFKLYDIALTPKQVQANYNSVISTTNKLKDTAHYTAYNNLVPNMNKDCGKWEVDGYWFRESGAFDKKLTTNELDTLCPQGSVCQDGVCVAEQQVACPDCAQGQLCINGNCFDGLELNAPKEFTIDGTCIKVTLTAINKEGTFNFEIGECEATVVTQPTLTLAHEDTGDFVASVQDLPKTVTNVYYNWYHKGGSDSEYKSITLLNLPLGTPLIDISGNNGVANIIDDTYLSINSGALKNLDKFTMEMVFSPFQENTGGPIFESLSSGLSMEINSDKTLSVYLDEDSVIKTCTSTTPLFVSSRNYIVLIYDNTKLKVMLNNKDYCEFDYTSLIDFSSINIGKKSDIFLENVDIGPIKIYGRIISPEQLQANYYTLLDKDAVKDDGSLADKEDAAFNAYNIIVVHENLACKDWKVTATLFNADGKVIGDPLKATSVMTGYCPTGFCSQGLCLDVTNCATDDNCASNLQNKKCLIEQEKVAEGVKACTQASDCSDGYSCDKLSCVKGTCVNPAYECLSNAHCTDPAKPYCVDNICSSTAKVDTQPPTPPSNTGSSTGGSGGGGGGGNDQCMLPQDSVKCHAQKAYTPCVQDKIIYKCLSKCGTSLLFQYDCKGNTPSYAQGCNNKMKDVGEEGVDCGGKCTVKCPDHCFNNKKDSDEYGIDCGGKKCKPCEEPMVKKEAPIITPPPTQPTVTPPVVETPLFDKIKGYWWTLIPFLLIIGLIIFLVTRKSHPHEEVVQGIEQPEELRKPFKGAEPPKETREEVSMKKDELKEFIKKELSGGKDREEISKNLERIGYNIDDVNSIFDKELHDALPKEYEQQIRKYVQYYLDKGNSPEEIRVKLKVQGWSDEVIDKFLVR